MKVLLSTVLAIVLFIAESSALKCWSCEGKGLDHDCHKPANELGPDLAKNAAFSVITCPEPENGTESQRAACMWSMTVYSSYNGEGAVSSRYCEIIDYADTCWTTDGGTTDSTFCACSDKDKCNSAGAISISLVTILTSSILAFFKGLL
jgi:hypothetical protein